MKLPLSEEQIAHMEIIDLRADDRRAQEQIAELLLEAFPQAYSPLEAALAEVRESLTEDRLSRIAVDDGTVLGWIGGIREYDGQAWELHPLVVHSEHRRRGIGRALVTDLEKRVQERGAVTLYLGTDDEFEGTSLGGLDVYPGVLGHLATIENLRTHPFEFYLRLGFEIVGIIPDANGFGKPDILMAKRVQPYVL